MNHGEQNPSTNPEAPASEDPSLSENQLEEVAGGAPRTTGTTEVRAKTPIA